LRLIRLCNTPENAFSVKNFCVAKLAARALSCAKKFAESGRDRVVFFVARKFMTAQKPLIHRHLCIATIFAQENTRAQNSLPRRRAGDAVVHRLRTPHGAVTHKI